MRHVSEGRLTLLREQGSQACQSTHQSLTWQLRLLDQAKLLRLGPEPKYTPAADNRPGSTAAIVLSIMPQAGAAAMQGPASSAILAALQAKRL